jgi:ABC-type lipoprotein release transport system permease subunit
MTYSALLLRNLFYHWRGNLAVLLGVLVGCTVLTGALLVGDSLRGSLRDQTQRRLGWVDQALVAPRFFRAALAREIEKDVPGAKVQPALMLRATVAGGSGADRKQVRGVTVLGVESGFFPDDQPAGFDPKEPPAEPFVWLSSALAEALGVAEGDRVTLRLSKPSALPRETALARKDVTFEDWEVKVARVLHGGQWPNQFNLRADLTPPRNAVVPLGLLQQQVGLAGQANTLLASGPAGPLGEALGQRLTLEDWGLVLRTPLSRARDLVRRYDTIDRDGKLSYSEWLLTREKGKERPRYAWVIEDGLRPASRRVRTVADFHSHFLRTHPYLSLESKQLFLTPQVADAALATAREMGLRAAPTLVYLCRMEIAGRRSAGVVAALDPAASFPLGPFRPAGRKALEDRQIVLADYGWSGPERPRAGSQVALSFKPPESHGPAPDQRATFTLAGYLPASTTADPGLTPEFPGITDREDVGAWDLPFDDPDWQKNISREYGDLYWKKYRTAPKAFMTLARGKELWHSRFGDLTSVRLAYARMADFEGNGLKEWWTGEALEEDAQRYRAALRRRLTPASGGFVFEDVKAEGLKASQGTTPFGWLFVGFSSFLILSALLLAGLLLRLNLDRRAPQVGLFLAEGFTRGHVQGLFLEEGLLLAAGGIVLGLLAALAYSRALVDWLAWLWPGGALRSLLEPHASPLSLVLGAGIMLLVSFVTVLWVVWVLGRVSPRALLAGQTTDEGEPGARPASPWLRRVAIAAVVVAVGLLAMGFFVPGQEAQASTFFGSGMLFLTAGLLGMLLWMRRERHGLVEGAGPWSITRLGVRNAARHPVRSLLAMGLLASAAFLIVAVESFRRQAEAGSGDKHASDGGFALLAESDLPIIRDLNSAAGRREVLDRLRQRLVNDQGLAPAEAEQEVKQAEALLKETTVFAFRARAGDDASCLNLYQPRTPRVLGVPQALIDRGGFIFDTTLAATPDEKANPWLLLNGDEGIPAFGEANTVTWMLKSGLGKQVEVPDETGRRVGLTIAGLLHDSVFQSSLLVSEENFKRLYPTHEGYNYFLIAPPPGQEAEVRRVLERALADRGFEVTPTRQRLQAYLAVENTYLSTFQALGGLGLLLGSLGLAVVLLRAVWERRGELALLRALGYRRATLAWLVLAENSFLLLAGLAVGSAAALLSILPQLVRGAGSVPWAQLVLLFAGVLVLALGAGALATAGALRAPLVPALRRE